MHTSEHGTWANYSETALATAVYPDRGNNIMYAALGLCGEAAELFDVASNDSGSNRDQERLIGELGDVAWYTAVVAHETGIDAGTLGGPGYPTRAAPPAAIVVAAGRIAELVKKAARDQAGHIDTLTRAKITSQLDTIIEALRRGAAAAGLGLTELLDANTAKLASRHERGALHGSGDFR